MLKTLLRSTGLATAVFFLPFSATGRLPEPVLLAFQRPMRLMLISGAVFPGRRFGRPWLSIGDADDGYDDHDGYNGGCYDGLRNGEDRHNDWDD